MSIPLPDELQARIDAAKEAEINSWYESLKERERKESQQRLDDIELERRRAVEQHVGKRPEFVSDGSSEATPSPREAPALTREKPAKRNGSSDTPTRRAMLLAVLPDFDEEGFIRRDVEEKILQRWPEAKGTTEAESRNFSTGLAGLLSDLTKKGRLKSSKGKTPFDPTVYYGVADKDEDTLLRSGP